MKIRQTKILGLALLLGGLALGGVGLWLLLSPAQYAATARIKVLEEQLEPNEIGPYLKAHPEDQTAFYFDGLNSAKLAVFRIQSDSFLSHVATNVNLNETLNEIRSDAPPLELAERIRIIKCHLYLSPVRGMKLVAIVCCSENPKMAATLANAIAEAYRDYRIRSRKDTIKTLNFIFEAEAIKITQAQTNLSLLSQQLNVTEQNSATNHPAEQNPYWDEFHNLILLHEQHKLLAAKIEVEKLESQSSRNDMVQIVDRAEPPQRPCSPNRLLGLLSSITGLIFLLVGTVVLKTASRRPA